MPSLSQAKSLGAVGSILVLLTAVPSIGGVLGIVGFILILIAIRYISEIVADKSIFNNMLIAVILAIAGIATGTLVVLGSVFRFMGLQGLNMMNFGGSFNPSTIPAGDWLGLIAAVLVGLVAIWALLLVSAVFVRRSYGAIASKLGVPMFGTAGLLYLIGAATTIVLVGFVLLFVAQILLAVAFFSIEEKKAPIPAAQPQPAVPANP